MEEINPLEESRKIREESIKMAEQELVANLFKLGDTFIFLIESELFRRNTNEARKYLEAAKQVLIDIKKYNKSEINIDDFEKLIQKNEEHLIELEK